MTDTVEFSSTAQHICKRLYTLSVEFNNESVKLKEELILSGVMNEIDDYDDVIKNKKLCGSLVQYVALGLSEEVSKSTYGKSIEISDFDLYFCCRTEEGTRKFFAKHFPYKSVCELDAIYAEIKKKVRAIQAMLYRLRDNIINNMQLFNTPDFELRKKENSEKQKKNKIERELKTREEIKEEVVRNLTTPSPPKKSPPPKKNWKIIDEDECDEGDEGEPLDSELIDFSEPRSVDELDSTTELTPEGYQYEDGFIVKKEREIAEEREEMEELPEDTYDELPDMSLDENMKMESDNKLSFREVQVLTGKRNIHHEESPFRKQFRTRNDLLANSEDTIQDLYETDPSQVENLLRNISINQDWIIFEPCCGNRAISDVFRKHGFEVIDRDLYFPDDQGNVFNYLEADFPPFYNCTITNPPFANKIKFLERAIESGKPFIFFLPSKTIHNKEMKQLVECSGLKILIPTSRPKFLHNKEWVHPEDVVWFLGNFEYLEIGKIVVEYMN